MYFIGPFLPGGVGMAVKNGEPPPAQHGLDQEVMLQELRPVVRGNAAEGFPEFPLSQFPLQPV